MKYFYIVYSTVLLINKNPNSRIVGLLALKSVPAQMPECTTLIC